MNIRSPLLTVLILFSSLSLLAQPKTAKVYVYQEDTVNVQKQYIPVDTIDYKNFEREKKMAIYFGLLNGGGSLVGADIEFLVNKHIGLQVGVGIVGYGFAMNVHFKPSIKSSGISLNYWHQGIGDSYLQSLIGSTYVYRSKKWFTFQVGLGIPLDTGPAFPEGSVLAPIMLMYSIGGYIAW